MALCMKCGGPGRLPRKGLVWVDGRPRSRIVGWVACERCKGSGRVREMQFVAVDTSDRNEK